LNILKRFANELTILLVTIFAVYALFYKISISKVFIEKQQEIKESIYEVNRIVKLKRFWSRRDLSKKVNSLKSFVNSKKILLFKKRSKSIEVKYRDLTPKELNKIVKLLVRNPFQIKRLNIKREKKESYSMELLCRW